MKKKKLNKVNLILLIIMIICLSLIAFDYLRILVSMLGSHSLGFTWFGIIIDGIALVTAELIYQILF